MTTLNTQVKQCHALIGTDALNAWEDEFISDLYERTREGNDTRCLTERQIEFLERIYNRHYVNG